MKAAAAVALVLLSVSAPASAADDTVATVAGEKISREQLEERVRSELIEIDNSRYQILRGGLDSLIAEKLLEKEAAARGVSVADLQRTEVLDGLSDPTDEEIQQVYDANQQRIGGAPMEAVREQIVGFLRQQQQMEKLDALLGELKKKHATVVLLEVPRIDIDTGGRASRGGGDDAPVTMIAFSDYECPYCRVAEKTVAQVRETYGDKVRYVHRDYPLPFHENAHAAAQAARCAGDQDKFWLYHDALWEAEALSQDSLGSIADEVGVDRAAFDECLSSGKFKAAVDTDMAAGAEVGVNGTPAFFINGRLLGGAQPFEALRDVIDEELARASASN